MKSTRLSVLFFAFISAGMLLAACTPTAAATATAAPLVEKPILTPTLEPTATIVPTPTLGVGSSMKSEKDGMTLMYVPAGEFKMGSNDYPGSSPVHTVYLDAYWIDKTEVSNAQYHLCVDSGACKKPGLIKFFNDSKYSEHPVIAVDLSHAKAYCEWAGRRLPTEAEWEKAARGTDQRTYAWGEGIDCTKANLGGCKEFSNTSPVGHYPQGASPYGVLDMTGNVWEWVSDFFGKYPSSKVNNPQGPSTGLSRIIRGGSWNLIGEWNEANSRLFVGYDRRDDSLGIRCVLST
jgi:formylglycine-generating enzyme required for sulfatase activity